MDHILGPKITELVVGQEFSAEDLGNLAKYTAMEPMRRFGENILTVDANDDWIYATGQISMLLLLM